MKHPIDLKITYHGLIGSYWQLFLVEHREQATPHSTLFWSVDGNVWHSSAVSKISWLLGPSYSCIAVATVSKNQLRPMRRRWGRSGPEAAQFQFSQKKCYMQMAAILEYPG
ncbi:hypothetical protein HUJ05_002052 [Dendroctonus ponderosae]|nr:hypothetical protein HUJ05_002052 [Dendroctonus ponderosae]